MLQTAPIKIQPKVINQIPEYILNNQSLKQAIQQLPANYNFEIQKSLFRIIETQNKLNKKDIMVSLQFPEGLMLYACMISDILTKFSGCETYISGDVTYGACCIDDMTAQQLGSDFIIHYGHSCLIPINETLVKTLYVFVEINIDITHLIDSFQLNFTNKTIPYYLMSTIQFNNYIHELKKALELCGYTIIIPQEKPRSQGEVLGCTSPKLKVETDNTVLFICDGRFHMESAMIQNPNFNFYQYNPYTCRLTFEKYDHKLMMNLRYSAIQKAQQIKPKLVCIILGTLGRQGNPHILFRIENLLKKQQIKSVVLLVSEVNFDHLLTMEEVDIFVQIACPRLSIDWSNHFPKPILTPYEFYVFLGETEWKSIYPMDYYSNQGGQWTNNYHKQKVQLQFE